MKLLIALAAVLSSAALTVPTVTNIAERGSADAGKIAALAAAETDENA